jgi:hypothetical protein
VAFENHAMIGICLIGNEKKLTVIRWRVRQKGGPLHPTGLSVAMCREHLQQSLEREQDHLQKALKHMPSKEKAALLSQLPNEGSQGSRTRSGVLGALFRPGSSLSTEQSAAVYRSVAAFAESRGMPTAWLHALPAQFLVSLYACVASRAAGPLRLGLGSGTGLPVSHSSSTSIVATRP